MGGRAIYIHNCGNAPRNYSLENILEQCPTSSRDALLHLVQIARDALKDLDQRGLEKKIITGDALPVKFLMDENPKKIIS